MGTCFRWNTPPKLSRRVCALWDSCQLILLSWLLRFAIHDIQKKAITKLQEGRTVKKILQLDKNIFMAYSGLTADGRILANRARMHAQSYRLEYDDDPSIEHLSKFIAETKQKYTQKGGVRPFGISCLLAGFDTKGKPHLYYTEPSGSFSEWKAQSCGRNFKQVNEYLEKHYKSNLPNEEALKLVIKALLDVVESGSRNIELMVLSEKGSHVLSDEEIEKLIEVVKQ